jgi:purine-nucleoside phosphorylase
METNALYSFALLHRWRALSILTVSDQGHKSEKLTADEREQGLIEIAELALTRTISA